MGDFEYITIDLKEVKMALKQYKTVKCNASDRFIEKKSEFIGYISPVTDEKDANDFICEIRNRHSDATHNCYAYVLQGTEIARFSDDGEPSGTAGAPILEVIKREGLSGVCIVVTRYFGGILLGAGGLVRAYAKGAKIAIDAADVCLFVPFTEFSLRCDYSDYEKLRRDFEIKKIKCDSTEFGSDVLLKLACRREIFDSYCEYAINLTNGKAIIKECGERFDAD